jgi:hypothetical protein
VRIGTNILEIHGRYEYAVVNECTDCLFSIFCSESQGSESGGEVMRLVWAYLHVLDPSLARERVLRDAIIDGDTPAAAIRWPLGVLR